MSEELSRNPSVVPARPEAASTAELHVLRVIAEALNRSVNLREALERSLEATLRLIGSEAGWMVLLVEDSLEGKAGTQPRLAVARNLPPALEADDRAAMQGSCQCLDLLRRGHLQAATHILECERLRKARGDTRSLRHHASVPIYAGGRALGILNLITPADRLFSDVELSLLAAISDQIGVSIERTQLHEQVKAHHIEEQAALLRLSQALLGASEAQVVMNLTVRATAEALKVEFVVMALIDADGTSVSAHASLGWPPELMPRLQRVPLEALPALAHAIRAGVPVVIPDESREARFPTPPWTASMGISSSLLAPMLAAEKAIGGLVASGRTPRDWSDDEVRLLALIANNTAQALERARLVESLAAEKRRLELLYNLSQNLTASLDPREVATRALDLTTSVLRVFKGEMLVLGPGSDRLRLVAVSGYDAESVEALDRRLDLRVGQGLAGRAALTHTPLIVPDVAQDKHWLSVPGVDDWVRSAVAIPLLAGDELVGVLNLLSDREGFFGAHDLPMLTAVATPIALALQKAWLFRAEREQRELAEALRDALGAGAALSATLNFDTVLDRLLEQVARVVPYDMANVMLLGTAAGHIRVARQRGYEQFGQTVAQDIGALSFDIATTANLRWMAETGKPLVIPDTNAYPGWVKVEASAHVRSWAGAPIIVEGQVVAFFSLDKIEPNFYRPEHGARLAAFAGQAALALQNAQLFEEVRRRAEELGALAEVSSALRQAQTREAMLPLLVETTMQLLGADAGTLLLLEGETLTIVAARGPGEALVGQRCPPGDDPLWQVARSGEPIFIPDVRACSDFARWEMCQALMIGHAACACVPLKTAEATVGLLHLSCRSRRVATEGDKRLLTSIAEMAGNALHRATLHEQTEQRLRRLTILRAIDMAISASLDLHITLNVFLDQVTTQLRLDASDVLLFNPRTQILEYAIGRGFRGSAITRTRTRLGEGHAGRAALERRIVHVSNLTEIRPAGVRTKELTGQEAFVTYYAVPLIAKAEVKGVLEIFHRTPLNPDLEWLDFLEALAVQAAIAIDNAGLFDSLQRSNVELALAYDTTIEGWSKALDLRDKETEGHTQRVTELTLRLAQAMGLPEVQLIHIRRGALLHDIGKMGIPDAILLKPGPLTDDEWEIMRQHPLYAYELLTPIAFLRPALDIPYCHHEKLDGTGYPRGLKGEHIPLAARIFALVDVWDALRSDRPYRPAWLEEKVLAYIRAQAGKHFDPEVVEAFMHLQIKQSP